MEGTTSLIFDHLFKDVFYRTLVNVHLLIIRLALYLAEFRELTTALSVLATVCVALHGKGLVWINCGIAVAENKRKHTRSPYLPVCYSAGRDAHWMCQISRVLLLDRRTLLSAIRRGGVLVSRYAVCHGGQHIEVQHSVQRASLFILLTMALSGGEIALSCTCPMRCADPHTYLSAIRRGGMPIGCTDCWLAGASR